MTDQKPPADPNQLIIRSTPFNGDDSQRLARHQQLEAAERRGRAQLLARGRWVGATGRRPRARKAEA